MGVCSTRGIIAIVAASALALSASPQEPAPNDPPATADERTPVTVRDTAREPEEVIVRPGAWQPGRITSFEMMQQIYDLRGTGACLYGKGKYAEAFPYLQAAARKGFKLAQARLAFLYQQGLGTEADPYAAIGWYGVAAAGTTLPEIRNGYTKILRSIPEEHRPAVSALVDEYKERYGARRHRVGCDLNDRAGTFLKTLTCRFQDEAIHIDHGRLVYGLSREGSADDPTVPVLDTNSVGETSVIDSTNPAPTTLHAGSSGC